MITSIPASVFCQDFRFGVLGKRSVNPLARCRPHFRSSHASGRFGHWPHPLQAESAGTLIRSARDFSNTSPSPLPVPPGFSLHAAHYPVDNGSDSIRRSIAPNSRRVKWLSARNNQYYRACLTNRPPVFTNFSCKLVSDPLMILWGNASRRHRFPKL